MTEDGRSTGRNMQQHIKEHFWIKINLCCVGMNKCRLWESKVASYSDNVGGKLGAGKVSMQTSFQILRRTRWREGTRHAINVLFIERILHNIKRILKLNRPIKTINNSNSNAFGGEHQYCKRSTVRIYSQSERTARLQPYSSERNTSSHICVWSRNIVTEKPKTCVDRADWHTEIAEELTFIIS